VVIAILMLIGGVLLLLSAVFSLMAAAWFTSDADGILGALFGVIGLIMLVLGLFYVFLALGLLKLKPWSRRAARALALIGIVLGLISLLGGDLTSVVNLVINIIIFWYLGTPDVKAAFSPVQRAFSSSPRYY
jgi:hypothetical protein